MKKGFTLIELLIAVSISSVILLISMTFLTSQINFYYKSINTAEATKINSKVLLTYLSFLEDNKLNIDSQSFKNQNTITAGENTISLANSALKVNGQESIKGVDSITLTIYNEKLTNYTIVDIKVTTQGISLETQYNLDKSLGGVAVEN